jgi:[acyl-carrier-protein] S-malonyltransferase
MGQSFYETDSAVKSLFCEAEAFRPGTLAQCFAGTEAELKQTENTQPCLYLADLAAAMALRRAKLRPDAVAGFSLGEIPALAFAGAFSASDGFRIACLRGVYMAEAANANPAAMLAVLRMQDEAVEELCRPLPGVWPVIITRPDRWLCPAWRRAPALREGVGKAGGKLMPLAVSGGFHCPLMSGAAERFRAVLDDFRIGMPAMPVYADCTALPYEGQPAELMVRQLTSPVLWRRLIENMARDGFDTFIETGVGSVLRALFPHSAAGPGVHGVRYGDVETVLREVGAFA